MDYYQSFKIVGQCLFIPPFICWFVLKFYNLVNGPVDNIVVRPSCVCGERKNTKGDGIHERKNASTAGPCPTIPKTIRRPDHWLSQQWFFFYIHGEMKMIFFIKLTHLYGCK